MLSRREFTGESIKILLFVSFADMLLSKNALAGPANQALVKWANDINAVAADLKGCRISALEGQRLVERFYDNIDPTDLMDFIDFSKLAAQVEFPAKGEKPLRIAFPDMEGMPSEYGYHADLVGLKRGRSIPPHGHNNQVTSFLVLKGSFRGRNFDRQDDESGFILTPTIDRIFAPGGHSSISDQKDNAHWFTAESDEAYLFDLAIIDLNTRPGTGNGRVYLDLRNGDMGDGRIRAKHISGDECYSIYG